MKLILSLMLVLSAHVLDAQIHISDLIKVADAQEYGDMRPRIELVNGTPNGYTLNITSLSKSTFIYCGYFIKYLFTFSSV